LSGRWPKTNPAVSSRISERNDFFIAVLLNVDLIG
jgi:hypothetical protein